MPRHTKLLGLSLFVAATALVTGAAFSSDESVLHERRVVAGLSVLFGGRARARAHRGDAVLALADHLPG